MKKTLVLFAHPYLEFSSKSSQYTGVYEGKEDFTFRDLYEDYPDFHIAAFRERKRLYEYDRFIFHFPLIWFGMPPLLRLWIDEVVDSKWVLEGDTNPFENREVYVLVTTRSQEEFFGKHGKYHYTIDELVSGLLCTLKLLKANIKRVHTIYESENLSEEQINEHKELFFKILKEG